MILGNRSYSMAGVVVQLSTLAVLVFYCLPDLANAQQILLNETFENDAPDSFPNSADFFARSSINPDPNLDPSTAVVTGGTFTDPFSPGNQSLVLHNPEGTTQMAVTWANVFSNDPSTFRNGSIEFDLYMETPDPNAFWTFFSTRIGYGDNNRSGISGAASDTTVWNTYRLQNQFVPDPNSLDPNAPEVLQTLEQVTDPGYRITSGTEFTYTDSDPNDVLGADRAMHVKYEIIETSTSGSTFNGFPVYRVTIDDKTFEWSDEETEHPWVFNSGAGDFVPGINIISFLTDASGNSVDQDPGTGNVYIDNLLIINNDLSPADADFDGDGLVTGSDFLIWQMNFGLTGQVDNSNGDANGDGTIDETDLVFWENQYGTSPLVAAVSVVPEPSALILAMLGCTIMLRRGYAR